MRLLSAVTSTELKPLETEVGCLSKEQLLYRQQWYVFPHAALALGLILALEEVPLWARVVFNLHGPGTLAALLRPPTKGDSGGGFYAVDLSPLRTRM